MERRSVSSSIDSPETVDSCSLLQSLTVNRLARDCGFLQLVAVSHSQSTRQRLWVLAACCSLSQSIGSPEIVGSCSLLQSLTVNRLARDWVLPACCSLSQSWGRIWFLYMSVLPSSTLKQCKLFVANCATMSWFLESLMVIGLTDRPLVPDGSDVCSPLPVQPGLSNDYLVQEEQPLSLSAFLESWQRGGVTPFTLTPFRCPRR